MRIRSKTLSRCVGVAHGFFGRKGGCSHDIYASLNCALGSQDAAQHVAENRERVRAELGAKQLVTLAQIHSAEVVRLDQPLQSHTEADAIVTSRTGIALGILTADCGPLLFADAQAGVIGAAHAGWRGAFNGVIENTIAAMEKLGAQRNQMTAALGPTIAQDSYQVDARFYDTLCKDNVKNQRFFVPSSASRFDAFAQIPPAFITHYQFDLPAYIISHLRIAGITAIDDLAIDTYTQPHDYFSYRRTVHEGKADYGRQISCIMIEETRV